MRKLWSIVILAVAFFSLGVPASRATVEFAIDLDKPVVPCGKKETVVLKVSLEADGVRCLPQRIPLNLAIVLDKSGSMSGQKIEDAKQAAIEAVKRLERNDIFSLVVFDSRPRVLIPAQRVTSKESVIRIIRGIGADRNTALYGGLDLGAKEIRKNSCGPFIPRIVLLSDGLANVGPSSTGEIVRLGMRLAGEGMTVTTVGVGLDYNEDLMTALANCSDGNSYFARNSDELPRIFTEELGDALSLAARDLRIKINCHPGVVPVSLIGREGTIRGQTAEVELKNLYANGDKYILLEVEAPSGRDESEIQLARVSVDYEDVAGKRQVRGEKTVSLRYSGDREKVERSQDREVIKDTTLTRVSVAKVKAIDLSDAGRTGEAAALMKENQMLLEKTARQCGNDKELFQEAENCEEVGSHLEGNKGLSSYSRKRIMNESYIQMRQQRYESR